MSNQYRDEQGRFQDAGWLNTAFGRTNPGIGPGGWDSGTLAREQERKATAPSSTQAVAYLLYTEDADGLRESLKRLVGRYFDGASFTYGEGLWQGTSERSVIVKILGTADDLQRIVHLAGDIRIIHGQQAVLLEWYPTSQFLVTA